MQEQGEQKQQRRCRENNMKNLFLISSRSPIIGSKQHKHKQTQHNNKKTRSDDKWLFEHLYTFFSSSYDELVDVDSNLFSIIIIEAIISARFMVAFEYNFIFRLAITASPICSILLYFLSLSFSSLCSLHLLLIGHLNTVCTLLRLLIYYCFCPIDIGPQ